MTTPVDARQSWDDFARAIAEVANVPVNDIGRDTSLVRDLSLDSLSLAEVVVLLIVDFDMETLSNGLEDRDWQRLTVGELYDEYAGESRAGRRGSPRRPA